MPLPIVNTRGTEHFRMFQARPESVYLVSATVGPNGFLNLAVFSDEAAATRYATEQSGFVTPLALYRGER